jgi:hypothetical protein
MLNIIIQVKLGKYEEKEGKCERRDKKVYSDTPELINKID